MEKYILDVSVKVSCTVLTRQESLGCANVIGFKHMFIRQIVVFSNMLLRGKVPEEVRPWMFGAKLAALPKPDGSLRPIAVGDTLRRLAGKLVLSDIAEDVKTYLEPVQLGVGTSGKNRRRLMFWEPSTKPQRHRRRTAARSA